MNLATIIEGHPAESRALISRGRPTDYGTLREQVAKLRELSPLWEMFQDGVDLSTVQWAAH